MYAKVVTKISGLIDYLHENRSAPWQILCARVIVMGALLVPILFATLGVFSDESVRRIDFIILYDAGKMLLNGENPYQLGAGPNNDVFAYPPTSSPYFELLGSIPFELSQSLFILLNYVTVFLLITFCMRTFTPEFRWRSMNIVEAICVASVIASPAFNRVLAFGQTSLVLFFFAYMAWHYSRKEKILPTAFFLALSTMKPQFSILIILWLCLKREYKPILTGGIFGVVLLTPILINFNLTDIFVDWFAAMENYKTFPFNTLGHRDVVGLQSLLVAAGFDIKIDFLVFALVLACFLFLAKSRFSSEWHLPLLILVGLTLIFGRDTDYVALIPVWLGVLVYSFKNPKYLVFVMALLAIFNLPKGLVEQLTGYGYSDIHPAQHWRTLVLICTGFLVIYWNSRYFNGNKKSVVTDSKL